MPNGCEVCDPTNKHLYCICDESWSIFNNLLPKFKETPQVSSKFEILKPFSISTITLCSNFGTDIDLKTLSEIYRNEIKYNPKGKKTLKESECFYNSLIMNVVVKYQNYGYVSIKLFPNGKVQIAGCKTIMSCAYTIRKAFSRVLKHNCFVGKPRISESRIVMINSDFKISKEINQLGMCEVLNSLSIHNKQKPGNFTQINYQNAKYPAINAKVVSKEKINAYLEFTKTNYSSKKFQRVISVLIFRPGSIILTGGNNLNEYLEIYTELLSIINENDTSILEK